MTKYIKVDWPESQKFTEYTECYIGIPNDRNEYTTSGCTYIVPEDLYNRIMYPEPELPSDKAEHFTKNFDKVRRGQKVIIYIYDSGDMIETIAESNSNPGFPVLLPHPYLEGFNCSIIAVEKIFKNG